MKRICLTVIFFVLVIFLNFYLISNLWSSNLKFNISNELIANIDKPEINIVEYLQDEYSNEDIKGVLSIDNSDYSSIVTQTNDNSFYLSRNIKKEKDGIGTPFIDSNINLDTSKKIIIYAHNSRYKEMPFKVLENFYDEDYYKTHDMLTLTLENETRHYKVFSIYVDYNDFSYYKLDFKSDNEYLNHLKLLKSKSIYESDIELSSSDNILILQTCSTLRKYSNYKHKFLVVIGKLVD